MCIQLTSGVFESVSKDALDRKDKWNVEEKDPNPEVAKRWQKGGEEVVGKLKQGFGDAFQDFAA